MDIPKSGSFLKSKIRDLDTSTSVYILIILNLSYKYHEQVFKLETHCLSVTDIDKHFSAY